MNTRLNPLNDYLFCKIMGEKGCEGQLLGFINAVLGRAGEDRFTFVEILENKSFSPKVIGDKSSILDVRAVLQDKAKVNVEVQLRNQNNSDKRSLFYWSNEFAESLQAGQDYRELPTVIAVNIVNFDYPKISEIHTRFHLREERRRDFLLTEALEIHFLNMVQYRKRRRTVALDDPLHRWLVWLNESSPPELISEVVSMDSAIQLAEERMALVSVDKEAMRAYRMRMMALSDQVSAENYARETGFAKGLKKGRNEERQYVMELLNQGLSAEEIKLRLGTRDRGEEV